MAGLYAPFYAAVPNMSKKRREGEADEEAVASQGSDIAQKLNTLGLGDAANELAQAEAQDDDIANNELGGDDEDDEDYVPPGGFTQPAEDDDAAALNHSAQAAEVRKLTAKKKAGRKAMTKAMRKMKKMGEATGYKTQQAAKLAAIAEQASMIKSRG